MTESFCCTPETDTHCKSTILLFKNIYKEKVCKGSKGKKEHICLATTASMAITMATAILRTTTSHQP